MNFTSREINLLIEAYQTVSKHVYLRRRGTGSISGLTDKHVLLILMDAARHLTNLPKQPVCRSEVSSIPGAGSRDGRFGSKVGQIGPKWDKSGAFSDQISVHLAKPTIPDLQFKFFLCRLCRWKESIKSMWFRFDNINYDYNCINQTLTLIRFRIVCQGKCQASRIF